MLVLAVGARPAGAHRHVLGRPLVTRELDAGTHRLAWTHTTRTRWLVAKLAFVGLAAMAAAGLLSLAVSWWAGPIDAAVASRERHARPRDLRLPADVGEIFDARGIVPIGYAAFAFALGVTVGVLVRRTLPAMAILLASVCAHPGHHGHAGPAAPHDPGTRRP